MSELAPPPRNSSVEPRVLTYETIGTGEPVVLVPGGLTGWLSWVPHAERLSSGRRAIRVQPIHNELGSAGVPGDTEYDVDTERESLRLTLEALEIDRADFAGWSGGGRALIEFTLEYPERVRTLTLVEPAAYSLLDEIGEDDPDVKRVNDLLDSLAGKEVTEDDLAQFLSVAGFIEDAADAPEHPSWSSWVPHRMALSWQSDRLGRLRRSVSELRQVRGPVLLVRGTTTASWERRVVDLLAAKLQDARLVELAGGHACHIESIDAFMVAFEEHLGSGVRA